MRASCQSVRIVLSWLWSQNGGNVPVGVLKRLFGYVRPYWKMLVATGILLLLQTGLSLLPPLLQRDIVDQVIGPHDLSRLGTVIVGLIGVYALLFLTEVGDQYIRHVLGARFILDLRVHIYTYLQRLSLSFFDRTSTGELMSRVTMTSTRWSSSSPTVSR